MPKLIAVMNVVAWAGFWSFGYLALTTPAGDDGRMVVAMVLAALGAGCGIWTWFRIVRHAEATGLAKPSRSRTRFDADEGVDA